jgi:hypothetical protein
MKAPQVRKCDDIFKYEYILSKKDLNHLGSWDVSKILIKINVVNSFIIRTMFSGISYDRLINSRQHVDFTGLAVLGDAVEIESKETGRDNRFSYIKVTVSKTVHNKKKVIAEGDFIFTIEQFTTLQLSLS